MRRLALRDLRSDEGLTLVETVVSLLVFALIMTGLAASMVAFARSSTVSRARATATAMAQQYTEKARAIGTTLLENCSNQAPAPPATAQFRNDGVQHTVPTGTDPYCIPYQQPKTQDGLSFTLTRLVLAKQPSQNDVAGQPQSEKYLVVQVSWTDAGGSAQSYELDTIFSQKGAIAVAPAQGIRFLIKDINGNVIPADASTWAISITGAGCPAAGCTDPTATTAEGTYSQLDLTPGTYTCTATTTTDGSSGYSSAPQPTYNSGLTLSADGTSISGSCVVTANTVTDFSTTWKSLTDCATSTTATGTVNFTVADPANQGLANMTVTMTQVNDGTQTVSGKTGAGGTIQLKPKANWYTYTVTDAANNYKTAQNSYGPVCIVANTTIAIPVTMQPVGGCVSTPKSTATLTVSVTDASTGNPLSNLKVIVTNTVTNTATTLTNATPANGSISKAMPGGPYTLTVTPPASGTNSNYQGSGQVGPFCLIAGTPQTVPVQLSTNSCTRAAGKTAFITFLVTDQNNNPINGASIQLINMNGDGNYSGTTGTDGKPTTTNAINGTNYKSIKLSDVDPYQYIVTAPNSNYQSTGTLGPICTIQNALVSAPTVVLNGLANATVTVQNNDVVPWKTYTINVIAMNADGTQGSTVSQVVTVPNCTPGTTGCTRNPSAGITFTGLVTGTYTIEVRTGANQNLVDSGSFNFTTPLHTYTSADFADLAMTDDSGGA